MNDFSVVDTAWIRDRAAEGYADHKFGGFLFDRWLEQVKADAWDMGYAEGVWHKHKGTERPGNPYRQQED